MAQPPATEPCDTCGGTMVLVPPPPPAQRVWRWFNEGRYPRHQHDYACPTCGAGAGVSSYYVPSGSLRGRVTHLRSHRTLQPVPRFYAVVGLTGLVLGALGGRFGGWQRAWWQVPAGALACAWAVMESSGQWDRSASVQEEPED